MNKYILQFYQTSNDIKISQKMHSKQNTIYGILPILTRVVISFVPSALI